MTNPTDSRKFVFVFKSWLWMYYVDILSIRKIKINAAVVFTIDISRDHESIYIKHQNKYVADIGLHS